MKSLIFNSLFFLSLLLFSINVEAKKKPKPNVIFILVDDLGYMDLGCYGSSFYETPNLDALAKKSVKFTNAYAASPVCSPTRSSIMTGKYPSRIKMTNHSGIIGPKGPGYKLLAPKPNGSLPLEEYTLAEALRDNGYFTAHVGKWHLQSHHEKGTEHYPEAHGFDVNVAGHNAGQPGSYFFPYQHPEHKWSNVPGLEDGIPEEYLTDRLTTEAISIIKEKREKPFFLNLWFYTVHTPLEGKKEKIEKYRAKAEKMGINGLHQGIPEHNHYHKKNQNNLNYAAMVESMDENIGRIIDALKKEGLYDNTIIIVTSDNGGLSTGKGKYSATSNLPLRAGKGWAYEGGIREPLLVYWPNQTQEGVSCDEPVVSTDFYPTILDMIGAKAVKNQYIDGISFLPSLKNTNASLKREAIYFHYPHYHGLNSMGPSGAIRMGDYKLVERFDDMSVELYNLKTDVGETKDISNDFPKITTKLKAKLHQWREESGAVMPTTNNNYDASKDPNMIKKTVEEFFENQTKSK
ncbi:sulfatase [Flammeovirga sp. EKP202]|uniref:sulfatase n=1 Tax=Flammeovirga sp. EKP202 TaxID=2770592 RepID=UPI00165FE753|nr:sulfatase [Flammeovirga sp. EKP202]MBD0400781.1 sulfatase [Flammeovirga sp. EKP202]